MTIFVGKTIEEAKQKAAAQLQPTANQKLEIAVLQQPRHGFLGIGRRQAKVNVTIKEEASQKKQEISAPTPELQNKNEKSQPTLKKDGELDPAEIQRRQQANRKKVQTASQQLVNYLIAVFKRNGDNSRAESN